MSFQLCTKLCNSIRRRPRNRFAELHCFRERIEAIACRIAFWKDCQFRPLIHLIAYRSFQRTQVGVDIFKTDVSLNTGNLHWEPFLFCGGFIQLTDSRSEQRGSLSHAFENVTLWPRREFNMLAANGPLAFTVASGQIVGRPRLFPFPRASSPGNRTATFVRRDVTVACSVDCRIFLKGKVRFPAASADKATLWHAMSKTGRLPRELRNNGHSTNLPRGRLLQWMVTSESTFGMLTRGDTRPQIVL